MMTGCCPYCGAEYALTEARCWECKLALPEAQPPTLDADDPGDTALYELDDWPAATRVELTRILAERAIPSRWEPGLTLAVRQVDEELAENVLDELEETALVDDEEDADGADEGDGGAVAQAGMADLFVAADRLMHEPTDGVVAADLGAAAGIVAENPPPFGIEEQLWAKVRELSAKVCSDLDTDADPDAVAADARTLREILRPLI